MKMVSQSVTDLPTDCRICKSCCSQEKRVKETCCRGTREWHKWQSLKLHYKTDSWQLITLQQNKDFQESRFIVIMNSIIQYKNRSTQSVRGIERERVTKTEINKNMSFQFFIQSDIVETTGKLHDIRRPCGDRGIGISTSSLSVGLARVAVRN